MNVIVALGLEFLLVYAVGRADFAVEHFLVLQCTESRRVGLATDDSVGVVDMEGVGAVEAEGVGAEDVDGVGLRRCRHHDTGCRRLVVQPLANAHLGDGIHHHLCRKAQGQE